MPSETLGYLEAARREREAMLAADRDLRRHYATILGILDPADTVPCWDDIVSAARAAGRRQERDRTAPLVAMVRQAYIADAVAEWFDAEGNGLKAALAVWTAGRPE